MSDLDVFQRYEWLASKEGIRYLKRVKPCEYLYLSKYMDSYRLVYLGSYGQFDKVVVYALVPKEYQFTIVSYFYVVNRCTLKAFYLKWNNRALMSGLHYGREDN